MKVDQMFNRIDHTYDIKKRVEEFLLLKDAVASGFFSEKEPEAVFAFRCKGCDFLDKCFLDYTKPESIFHLPRLSEKQFNELLSLNIKSIKEIPSSF